MDCENGLPLEFYDKNKRFFCSRFYTLILPSMVWNVNFCEWSSV